MRTRIQALLLAVLSLGACTVKTTVQVTATTPAAVTHLYVTVKELWFTTQAAATTSDNTWVRKVLSDPVTIDLSSLNDGTTASLASLTLDVGTYAQIRLVLADVGEDLVDSADALGLAWNNAVQYVDAAGVTHLVGLELPHPGASLLIAAPLELGGNSSLDSLSLTTDETSTVVVDIDALQGLILFTDNGEPRAMLSPVLRAHDQSKAGTLTGTFDLSGITSPAGGKQGIVVSAEVIDTDGTRHAVVKSTRLRSDGSFTLSPLPDDSTYDIVVQGAGVTTLLVTGIAVKAGETTTLQTSSIPLSAASTFLVNTANTVYGGTFAEFYQTLPTSSKPYLIDSLPVNPFAGGFFADQALSAGPLMYGAYNAGGTISFTTANADEGLARYQLAGNSRWRASSSFVTVAGNSGGSTTVQSVTVPQPALPANALTGSVSGTVFIATAGRYDSVQMIVSRGGQIVDTRDLGSSLGQSTAIAFTIANLPARTADAVYDLSIRAWNSRDPANTLVRVALAAPLDLRQNSVTGLSLQL